MVLRYKVIFGLRFSIQTWFLVFRVFHLLHYGFLDFYIHGIHIMFFLAWVQGFLPSDLHQLPKLSMCKELNTTLTNQFSGYYKIFCLYRTADIDIKVCDFVPLWACHALLFRMFITQHKNNILIFSPSNICVLYPLESLHSSVDYTAG